MGTEDVAIRSVKDWRAEFDRINAVLARQLAIAAGDTQWDDGYNDGLRDALTVINGGEL